MLLRNIVEAQLHENRHLTATINLRLEQESKTLDGLPISNVCGFMIVDFKLGCAVISLAKLRLATNQLLGGG